MLARIQIHSGAFEMTRFLVAAVTTIALAGSAVAADTIADRTSPAPIAVGVLQMAMGPTSAAHVPGGAADGPKETSSTCAPPCPRHHRRKHRH